MAYDMLPFDEFGAVRLEQGDVLKKLRSVENGSIDLIISSPPYNIGKIYEKDKVLTLPEYRRWQKKIIKALSEKAKDNASICWQVGSYVKDGGVYPLDIMFYPIFADLGWVLRNRIVWRFNFGLNSDRRFSGRYETVLWFTRGKYTFNLKPVRVPQLYPGKRHSKTKGDRAGKPSGNPDGKNPSDFWEFSAERDFIDNPFWDLPNVKANHAEQTAHPCQFPVELAERCILALTNRGDVVLDPFVGAGSSMIAASKQGRSGIGIDKEPDYIKIAEDRIALLRKGDLPLRRGGMPVRRPVVGEKVATIPTEWQTRD
jgi:DNA modification methylase